MERGTIIGMGSADGAASPVGKGSPFHQQHKKQIWELYNTKIKCGKKTGIVNVEVHSVCTGWKIEHFKISILQEASSSLSPSVQRAWQLRILQVQQRRQSVDKKWNFYVPARYKMHGQELREY